METIKYKAREITPIMRPMLVWDDYENEAVEEFIYAKENLNTVKFPYRGRWRCGSGVWKNAKELPKEEIVELTLKDIVEGKGVGVPEHLIRIKL